MPDILALMSNGLIDTPDEREPEGVEVEVVVYTLEDAT